MEGHVATALLDSLLRQAPALRQLKVLGGFGSASPLPQSLVQYRGLRQLELTGYTLSEGPYLHSECCTYRMRVRVHVMPACAGTSAAVAEPSQQRADMRLSWRGLAGISLGG